MVRIMIIENCLSNYWIYTFIHIDSYTFTCIYMHIYVYTYIYICISYNILPLYYIGTEGLDGPDHDNKKISIILLNGENGLPSDGEGMIHIKIYMNIYVYLCIYIFIYIYVFVYIFVYHITELWERFAI
jgi:hypothetical protein